MWPSINGFPFGGVVFDLDGTLIDSYAAINQSLNEVLEHFGHPPVSREATRRLVGNGLEALITKVLGRECVEEGVRLFRQSYEVSGPEKTELLPGADELTRHLLECGIPMGVASNKPLQFSHQLLHQLGMKPRMKAIMGPTPNVPPKPDPAMVLAALRVMNVKPKDSLYVGDMPIDIETARSAGMKVAVLPTGSSSREELVEARPDWIFDSLFGVLQLFQESPAG